MIRDGRRPIGHRFFNEDRGSAAFLAVNHMGVECGADMWQIEGMNEDELGDAGDSLYGMIRSCEKNRNFEHETVFYREMWLLIYGCGKQRVNAHRVDYWRSVLYDPDVRHVLAKCGIKVPVQGLPEAPKHLQETFSKQESLKDLENEAKACDLESQAACDRGSEIYSDRTGLILGPPMAAQEPPLYQDQDQDQELREFLSSVGFGNPDDC